MPPGESIAILEAMKPARVLVAFLLVSSLAASADELHLKDGTKITGTIVGYQGNSFRVKTSYGFALVDRASVVSITVSNPAERPPAAENAADHKADRADAKIDVAKTEPAIKASPSLAGSAKASTAVNTGSSPTSAPPSTAASPAGAVPAAAPATSPAATPSDPTPGPLPVREEVQGNLYVNETYRFQIYKPPGWELIDGARAALPGSIAALGTADQTTYLLVGLETSSDPLTAHIAETNERLGEAFDGFQPGPLHQTTIAGLQGYEYQFHGMANHQSWAGTVALFSRGEAVFTIFGVTVANSDLVQIQQNVIARAIASLQFTAPK